MNLKKELRRMKHHRDAYFPVMEKLLALHTASKNSAARYEFTDFSEMIVILELLDLGYLDDESFIVVKNFNDVARIIYKGGFPLTPAGEGVLRMR